METGKIFTENNTWNDIITTVNVSHLKLLLPEIIMHFIPDDQGDVPLKNLTENRMPGVYKEMILRAANNVHRLTDGEYELSAVWSSRQEGFPWSMEEETEKNVVFFYRTEKAGKKKPAVIICPGGGYELVSGCEEGILVADEMEKRGVKAFVLHYRVKPDLFPAPQEDLIMSVLRVRADAEKYGIDPQNIMLMGFSAGGHLCGYAAAKYGKIKESVLKKLSGTEPKLASALASVSARPDKVCLGYPVISFLKHAHESSFQALSGGKERLRKELSVEEGITEGYPQTFIWACSDDDCVSVENTRIMEKALTELHIPHKIQIYPTGGHGIGTAEKTSAEGWIDVMIKFFNQNGN